MNLKSFYLKKARYEMMDNIGNKVALIIKYWDGCYEIKYLKILDPDELAHLKQKADQIAQKLLGKKHRVNFSYKFKNG